MFRALLVAFLICASPGHAETNVKVAAVASSDVSPRFIAAPKPAVDHEIAGIIGEWHRLRGGRGSLADAMRFLEAHADWPGLRLLRRKAEENLPIGERADVVLAFFDGYEPQTGRGARALIAALKASGDLEAAHDRAILTWRTLVMTAADEAALLGAYGDLLRDHNEARLDMLLWRDATKGARRMLPRVGDGWKKLAEARMALRARKGNVNALINRVPKSLQGDPGLAFERMQWRARKGLSETAMELIHAASPDALGEPARWAGWRRAFARSEMRAGRIDNAYALAASHGLEAGSHFADLEWLAGYIALTYKEDGGTALAHFLRFRGAVETPISLGRAGYWEGRAHELLGDAEAARLAYAFGAEYQTSFYGLLAAERAGLPMDPGLVGEAEYPDWRVASFADTTVFRAARHFVNSDGRNLAEQFLRHMVETLPAEEIGSLGDYALSRGEPHLAVMIGKQAARRGIVVPRAYYPLASLGLVRSPVPQELALAIARRESEFDPVVTSHAGARGLMQLMPATAKAVASDLGIRYQLDRLLTDPAYNARLGTAYLDELMELFEGNVVMVSAGYNAGPGRPIRWMSQRGNPLQGEIDIVDWIEHIPFDETRNYVMRVAESLPIYRAQLTGQVAPLVFTAELVGTPGHARQAVKGEVVRPKPRPRIAAEVAVAEPEPVPDVSLPTGTERRLTPTRPRARSTAINRDSS